MPEVTKTLNSYNLSGSTHYFIVKRKKSLISYLGDLGFAHDACIELHCLFSSWTRNEFNSECVAPGNIHTSPMEGFLIWALPPLEFQFSFILSFINFGCCDLHPHQNFQWPSMGWLWIFSGTRQCNKLITLYFLRGGRMGRLGHCFIFLGGG